MNKTNQITLKYIQWFSENEILNADKFLLNTEPTFEYPMFYIKEEIIPIDDYSRLTLSFMHFGIHSIDFDFSLHYMLVSEISINRFAKKRFRDFVNEIKKRSCTKPKYIEVPELLKEYSKMWDRESGVQMKNKNDVI